MTRTHDKDQAALMGEEQSRAGGAPIALIGGLIVAAVLLFTALWVSNGATQGTQQAVGQVSEFYLSELAINRARRSSQRSSGSISPRCTRHLTCLRPQTSRARTR